MTFEDFPSLKGKRQYTEYTTYEGLNLINEIDNDFEEDDEFNVIMVSDLKKCCLDKAKVNEVIKLLEIRWDKKVEDEGLTCEDSNLDGYWFVVELKKELGLE